MDPSVASALRTHPLFQSLTEDELGTLAVHAQAKSCPAGAYVFRESQPRRAFGVLVKGRVQIVTGFNGRPQVLHLLTEGESFGEGSLLDDYPHSTSGVVSEEPLPSLTNKSMSAGSACGSSTEVSHVRWSRNTWSK